MNHPDNVDLPDDKIFHEDTPEDEADAIERYKDTEEDDDIEELDFDEDDEIEEDTHQDMLEDRI